MRERLQLDREETTVPLRTRRAEPVPVEQLLRLQRSAGNAAVQRALLQRADVLGLPGTDERVRDAIAGGDWEGAARILLAGEERWMVGKLRTLSAGELRYLDDAVRRMGVRNSRLRIFIRAGLRFLGADDDQAAPGAGHGLLVAKLSEVQQGERRRGGNKEAALVCNVWFTPNAAAVDADEIAFIQTARVRSTASGTVDDFDGETNWDNRGANGEDRMTRDHTRVDRLAGSDQGWYGMPDAGGASWKLTPWTRGSKTPAWMRDRPSRTVGDVEADFETAAICRAGPDAGKVYATVTWGFTIDGQLKIVPKEPVLFHKESPAFDLAVAFWNAEAAVGGGTQKPLPSSLH